MLPVVRLDLEIEGMRAGVARMLNDRHRQIEAAVDQQIQKALENYPFEERVNKYTHQEMDTAISEAIGSWLKYGEGRKFISGHVAAMLEGAEERVYLMAQRYLASTDGNGGLLIMSNESDDEGTPVVQLDAAATRQLARFLLKQA